MFANAVNVDAQHVQPERNPAITGALITEARRNRHKDAVHSTAIHYYAKTTYRNNYFYWFLFALSIIASLFYFIVRIIYIAQGNSAPKLPLNLEFVDPTRPGDSVQDQIVTLAELLPAGMGVGDSLSDELLAQPQFANLRKEIDEDTYSYWWSCVVLLAEIGGFILVHISQQMFVRQDTKFYPLPPQHVQKLRDVRFRPVCASL